MTDYRRSEALKSARAHGHGYILEVVTWISIPRILHPYPHARFNATHPS